MSLDEAAPEIGADAPLAARVRPRSLAEFVGQEHVAGPGRLLRTAIQQDRLPSLILWGPPGTGKTTLARIIANSTKSRFVPMSAVTAGVADLRQTVADAKALRAQGQRTILFIDEIHRFNKAQQDVILPHVEDGTVTLIGATTENPSFEVNAPLLSRARVVTLRALQDDELQRIVLTALEDEERGLGGLGLTLDEDALRFLVDGAGGDARAALNVLEIAAEAEVATGVKTIGMDAVREAMQRRSPYYDKKGDAHYDAISAYIKSVRGSDVDAALYWLARMIEAGEDPLFIVRRMVILAAEDVGLADPQALVVATACQQAVHFIGLPEGFLPMAETTIYLAAAPKSNSALTAYVAALKDAEATSHLPVPLHLRNAPTGLMKAMGYGKGYRYAHDYEGHVVEQQHRPDDVQGNRYYEPGTLGFEAEVARRLTAAPEPPPDEDDLVYPD
jgi:putative ATPase